MNKYVAPEMTVVTFEVADVVTTSVGGGGENQLPVF